MNTNLLLAVSAAVVGTILLSANHAAISDFYAYSVPYNDFAVAHMVYSLDPDSFQMTKQQQGSACFVTPSNNEYCYKSPNTTGNFLTTYIVGSNGIDGEMHLYPVNNVSRHWAIAKIVPVSETVGVITFSYAASLGYGNLNDPDPPEEFEFTKTVTRYDTFVTNCRADGIVVDIVQYLGVVTVEGAEHVAIWHVHAESERGIPCKYPEIIKHSFGHDFGI